MKLQVSVARAATAIGCASAVVLTGCASSSAEISASYVSPLTYRNYDCDQITAEVGRIQGRVQQLGARLDQAASNDKKLVGVGMILFWPALFALGGTKEQEAEFARLKGEHDALQVAAIEKKCMSAGAPAKPAVPPTPTASEAAPAPAAAASR